MKRGHEDSEDSEVDWLCEDDPHNTDENGARRKRRLGYLP